MGCGDIIQPWNLHSVSGKDKRELNYFLAWTRFMDINHHPSEDALRSLGWVGGAGNKAHKINHPRFTTQNLK